MNLVYFGSDVHYQSFCYLVENHNVTALYTYHNDEDFFTEYQIAKTAKKHNIPVYYDAITEEQIIKYFKDDGCDLFFVAEYDRIIHIPAELEQFRGINIHLSLLPTGRSYYPIENAMHNGLKNTGVTMHRLAPHPDTGEILFQQSIPVDADSDSIDIYIRAAKAARLMTQRLMSDFEACWSNATVQVGQKEYWKRPEREHFRLHHSLSVEQARQIVRVFNKMTEAEIEGAEYYVSSAVFSNEALPEASIRISDNMFLYGVRDGHIRLAVCKKT